MCRRLSPGNCIGFVVLLLAAAAWCLCFAAPFWLIYPHAFKEWKVKNPPENLSVEKLRDIPIAWKGLLAYCFSNLSCHWVWEDNFDMWKTVPVWYNVSQISGLCGVFFVLLAILLQFIYSSRCCKDSYCFPTAVATFLLFSALAAGVSIGVFGGFAYRDGWFDFMESGGYTAKFDWAFYTGVGAVVGLFAASFIFFCDGCCLRRTYRNYSHPKV